MGSLWQQLYTRLHTTIKWQHRIQLWGTWLDFSCNLRTWWTLISNNVLQTYKIRLYSYITYELEYQIKNSLLYEEHMLGGYHNLWYISSGMCRIKQIISKPIIDAIQWELDDSKPASTLQLRYKIHCKFPHHLNELNTIELKHAGMLIL